MILHVGSCPSWVRDALTALLPEHERFRAQAGAIASAQDVFYTNLFAQKLPPRLDAEKEAVLEQVREALLRMVYKDSPVWPITCGFIESPVGSRVQYWHYDYGGRTENIFVPITPLTKKNGTEYVEWLAPDAGPAQFARYGERAVELMTYDIAALQIAEPYTLRRSTAQPYEVLHMPWHVLHRGNINSESFVRLMFFICTTQHEGFDLEAQDKQPVVSWG